ncbi:MAG: 50S ribosomal protein L3 [Actinomycetota bacterium]|jgi:large subunit ribosomal protein L3|nr:50S ribosomal protein L3 [Rubrobacter sp.]MDQ3238308.1 50S ribosomal protein L3 [Actinomycetota bacterium]MDQ3568816.1 50S ribosomal protein L3 [Actinomycetota bacterium]
MATAIFGRKKHMTQAFEDDGTLVSATVITVEPNFITASRTADADGYDAVQVGFGTVPSRKVNKPHAGQFEKHETPPRKRLKELRGVTGEVGESIGVDVFEVGDKVHVSATAKGKGFQGTVKRHRFGRGPVSHGSHNVRAPGSVGASADPARVFRGQKMPGQMGNKAVTVKNLRVVNVDAENGEIWVRGGVPGGRNAVVRIRKAGE